MLMELLVGMSMEALAKMTACSNVPLHHIKMEINLKVQLEEHFLIN